MNKNILLKKEINAKPSIVLSIVQLLYINFKNKFIDIVKNRNIKQY